MTESILVTDIELDVLKELLEYKLHYLLQSRGSKKWELQNLEKDQKATKKALRRQYYLVRAFINYSYANEDHEETLKWANRDIAQYQSHIQHNRFRLADINKARAELKTEITKLYFVADRSGIRLKLK